MSRVTYHPTAELDLHEIWEYVAEASQSFEIADRLLDKLDAASQIHSAQPYMGELRSDIAAGIGCFSVGAYIVMYVPMADGIEVVQVDHGSRDLPTRHRHKPRDSQGQRATS